MTRFTLFSFSTAFLSAALVALVAAGCGDDDDSGAKPDAATTDTGSSGSSGTSGTSGSDSSTKPQPPALGAQIDRMGRPAVNTAVNKTFAGAARDPARDAYNADKDNTGWGAKYAPEVAGNLAIYDGVDRNCGNQAFAKAASNGPAADKYGTLAGVLADDRLWLDTSSATCNQYLGVELNATGAVPNTDCGGRTLKYDVIDITYTVVASTLANPVTDGIAADPVKTGGTTFPYLAP